MPEAADDWVGMCIALRWADLAIEFRLLGSSEPGQFDLSIKKWGTIHAKNDQAGTHRSQGSRMVDRSLNSKPRQDGDSMDSTLELIVCFAFAWWLFTAGKRIGSHKGYHVGRVHGRRSRR